MRPIATVRFLLWRARPPIKRPARATLGGTNRGAEDQSTPDGTRGRVEPLQRRSDFGDFTGRLARTTNGASSHVVARTANGASSHVVLGELSPSLTNLSATRCNCEVPVAARRRPRRGSACDISNLVAW